MSPCRLMTEATGYRFSGVAGRANSSTQGLILRVMEVVAIEEGYCSEDLLLRVVGWKGLLKRAEKAVGWKVKQSASHMKMPTSSGISLQVS